MKNKLILPISIILGCLILGLSFYFIQININKDDEVKKISPSQYWMESRNGNPKNVVCDLKVSGVVKFQNEEISIESGIENNSTKLTFIDLNTDNPYMIGNMGDKVDLVKIDDDNGIIYLIENTFYGQINVFSLFKEKNIMIMSKQYELLGSPFGLIMMGDCSSGV
jgi:hypothetical protein